MELEIRSFELCLPPMLTCFTVPALRNSTLCCKQTFCKKVSPISSLESALVEVLILKCFKLIRMNTYGKPGGRGPALSVLPFRRQAGANLDFAAIRA
jgi:hypothetical protein